MCVYSFKVTHKRECVCVYSVDTFGLKHQAQQLNKYCPHGSANTTSNCRQCVCTRTFVISHVLRQHGQPVRTPVGVVIQEMAPAEAAGWNSVHCVSSQLLHCAANFFTASAPC